jgi:hypothetical protein
MQDFLTTALDYADRGYMVFPCVPGEKKPLTSRGLLDATTDAGQIEAWWTQYSNANIGIATTGLIVIDIDGADNSWLADDVDKQTDLAQVVSLTPSGGRHHIFRQPEGRNWRNTASRIAPKVDTRANGGYIVAPSSIVNGKPYRWAPGMELSMPAVELPEPPAWLVEILDGIRGNLQAPTCSTPLSPSSDVEKRALAYLDAMPPAISGQGGHNVTYSAATMLVHGFEIPQDQALEMLLAHYNPRCEPPWTEKELRHKVQDAATKSHNKSRGWLRNCDPSQGVDLSQFNIAPEHTEAQDDDIVIRLSDVTPQPITWLWPLRIARGKLTVIAGNPGLGKSFITLDLAARVSRGDGFPLSPLSAAAPGGVVLLSAEDDLADTIRPRLDTAGADPTRIVAMNTIKQFDKAQNRWVYRQFTLSDDLARLETAIRLVGNCVLVIIDPISAYLGSTDSHNNSEVRGLLAPLSELAARHKVAVVVVSHLNKGTGDAINRVMGSLAFVAAARAAYVITKDQNNPSRRLFLPAKNNLGVDDTGLAYQLTGSPVPYVKWEALPVNVSADDALLDNKNPVGRPPDDRQEAEEWLLDALKNGSRPAAEILSEARKDGFARVTLMRAKAALGVTSMKQGYAGGWVWALPEDAHKGVDVEESHEEYQAPLPQ